MKKSFKSIVAVIVALMCILSVAACKKSKGKDGTESVALVGFEDETITVELGDTVNVQPYLTVLDEDGNSYHAQAVIKTKAGADVRLLSNEFSATDTEGYIISVSVEVPKSKNSDEYVTRTRKITINTGDTTKPSIIVGDLPEFGTTGETYTVSYTVKDYNPTTSTLSIVFVEADGTETPVQHNNGTFTAAEPGEYKITITASDGINEPNTKVITFFVRDTMKDYMLEEFSDKLSVDDATNYIKGYSSTPAVWLKEFEGRNGVVGQKYDAHQLGKDGYHNFAYKFNRTKAWMDEVDEDDWDYVVISLYIDAEGTFTLNSRMWVFGEFEGKKWNELKITKDLIHSPNTSENGNKMSFYSGQAKAGESPTISDFNKVHTQTNGFDTFYISSQAGVTHNANNCTFNDIVVYTDYIRYAMDITLDATTQSGNYNKNEEITLSASSSKDGAAFVYEVFDEDGNSMTLNGNKFTPTASGLYTIKASLASDKSYGVATKDIVVLADAVFKVEELPGTLLANAEYTLPEATFAPRESGISLDLSKASDITVKVTYNGSELPMSGTAFWTQGVGERYTITYSALYDGDKVVYSYQVDTVAGYVNSIVEFATESSVASMHMNDSYKYRAIEPVWYKEFQGRYGVVATGGVWNDTGTRYKNFMIKSDIWTSSEIRAFADSATDKESGSDAWDYISAWIWIDKAGDNKIIVNNDAETSPTVPGRQWYELKIPKADILKSAADAWSEEHSTPTSTKRRIFQSIENMGNIFGKTTSTSGYLFYIDETDTNTTVYIDSVRLIKNVGLTATVSSGDDADDKDADGKMKNNEITVGVNSAYADGYTVSYSVTYNGLTTVLSGNTFTPAKSGKYYVAATVRGKVNGSVVEYIGYKTLTILNDVQIDVPGISLEVYEGSLYTVPTNAVLKDMNNGGEQVDPENPIDVKVTQSGDEVTLTDGYFIAGAVGSVYTVTYSTIYDGEKTETTYDITTQAIPNSLVEFSSEASVSSITSQNAGQTATRVVAPKWHNTWQGRYGVVSTGPTVSGAYNNFIITSDVWTADELSKWKDTYQTDWDYLSVWLWIDKEGTFKIAATGHTDTQCPGKQWFELKVFNTAAGTASNQLIITNLDAALGKKSSENSSNRNLFYLEATSSSLADSETVVYIDSIRFVKANAAEIVADDVAVVGNDVNLSVNAQASEVLYSVGYESNEPTIISGNTFTPDKLGNWTVTADITYDGGKVTAMKTIEVTAEYTNVVENYENMTADDIADCFLHNTDGTAPTAEQLADYKYEPIWDGRSGVVLAYGDGSQYDNFYAKTRKTHEVIKSMIGTSNTTDPENGYKDGLVAWDYVSIWVWIDHDDKTLSLSLSNSTTVTIKTKQWQEIIIGKTTLREQQTHRYDNLHYALASHTSRANINTWWFMKKDLPADTKIYIDSISLCKYVDLTSSETATKDQPYTISAKMTDTNRTDATFTYVVTDPSGNKVELSNGTTFTPNQAGEYVVEIMAKYGSGATLSMTRTQKTITVSAA